MTNLTCLASSPWYTTGQCLSSVGGSGADDEVAAETVATSGPAGDDHSQMDSPADPRSMFTRILSRLPPLPPIRFSSLTLNNDLPETEVFVGSCAEEEEDEESPADRSSTAQPLVSSPISPDDYNLHSSSQHTTSTKCLEQISVPGGSAQSVTLGHLTIECIEDRSPASEDDESFNLSWSSVLDGSASPSNIRFNYVQDESSDNSFFGLIPSQKSKQSSVDLSQKRRSVATHHLFVSVKPQLSRVDEVDEEDCDWDQLTPATDAVQDGGEALDKIVSATSVVSSAVTDDVQGRSSNSQLSSCSATSSMGSVESQAVHEPNLTAPDSSDATEIHSCSQQSLSDDPATCIDAIDSVPNFDATLPSRSTGCSDLTASDNSDVINDSLKDCVLNNDPTKSGRPLHLPDKSIKKSSTTATSTGPAKAKSRASSNSGNSTSKVGAPLARKSKSDDKSMNKPTASSASSLKNSSKSVPNPNALSCKSASTIRPSSSKQLAITSNSVQKSSNKNLPASKAAQNISRPESKQICPKKVVKRSSCDNSLSTKNMSRAKDAGSNRQKPSSSERMDKIVGSKKPSSTSGHVVNSCSSLSSPAITSGKASVNTGSCAANGNTKNQPKRYDSLSKSSSLTSVEIGKTSLSVSITKSQSSATLSKIKLSAAKNSYLRSKVSTSAPNLVGEASNANSSGTAQKCDKSMNSESSTRCQQASKVSTSSSIAKKKASPNSSVISAIKSSTVKPISKISSQSSLSSCGNKSNSKNSSNISRSRPSSAKLRHMPDKTNSRSHTPDDGDSLSSSADSFVDCSELPPLSAPVSTSSLPATADVINDTRTDSAATCPNITDSSSERRPLPDTASSIKESVVVVSPDSSSLLSTPVRSAISTVADIDTPSVPLPTSSSSTHLVDSSVLAAPTFVTFGISSPSVGSKSSVAPNFAAVASSTDSSSITSSTCNLPAADLLATTVVAPSIADHHDDDQPIQFSSLDEAVSEIHRLQVALSSLQCQLTEQRCQQHGWQDRLRRVSDRLTETNARSEAADMALGQWRARAAATERQLATLAACNQQLRRQLVDSQTARVQLQQELDRSMVAQKNLLQQVQETENESQELHEFMQLEKSALIDALDEAESEKNGVLSVATVKDDLIKDKEKRCTNLLRLAESRAVEIMKLKSETRHLQQRLEECQDAPSCFSDQLAAVEAALQQLLQRLQGSYVGDSTPIVSKIRQQMALINGRYSPEGEEGRCELGESSSATPLDLRYRRVLCHIQTIETAVVQVLSQLP